MIMDRQRIRHEILNATGGIYWVLKPYWRQHVIDDQHWAYVLKLLKRIEGACDDTETKAK